MYSFYRIEKGVNNPSHAGGGLILTFNLVCWLYTKKRSANFGIPLNGWYQSNAGGWELIEDVKISMRD